MPIQTNKKSIIDNLFNDKETDKLPSVALEVKNFSKTYGSFVAVKNLSFEVKKGEIFGLLGPNGAGKTSLIESIEGIRVIDSGEIRIFGKTMSVNKKEILQRIGVQLQTTGLLSDVTVIEVLRLFASFYKKSVDVKQLLALFDLSEKSNVLVNELSGGMRQRLLICLTMLNNPNIIFLDEPTTGLDPQSRRNLWDIINCLRTIGKTILLTTHYMEEAEALCDRIAIIDKGSFIDIDSPGLLIKKHIGEKTIEFNYEGIIHGNEIEKLPSIKRYWINENESKVIVISDQSDTVIQHLMKSNFNECSIKDLSIRRGNLEDVFLKLTNGGLA